MIDRPRELWEPRESTIGEYAARVLIFILVVFVALIAIWLAIG